MVSEKVILQVLTEQKEEVSSYNHNNWVARKEEDLLSRLKI